MALDPSPTQVYSGPFDRDAATRLLWRAGFGPAAGQADAVAALGLEGAVASLTRPRGSAQLIGAAPHNAQGQPLDPDNTWGDDHVWWLDRMVRSNQPLIERMTLIWHSWFATAEEASSAKLMIAQNWTLRRNALGRFDQLLRDVTVDPAMLMWLNGTSNRKGAPNENYGREMLELFTLGADRGYTQHDVHENARALTGWTNDWSQTEGPVNFRFDPQLHDDGIKRIFGHRGRFNWKDSCHLAVHHPCHPSFFVEKLWGYFIGAPLPAGAAHALERHYVASGFQIRPIVEAILRHPLFYEGPRLVTPPVVWTAGILRASGQTITTSDWAWVAELCGQMLFQPPNVAGWDYSRWLDTARWAGRLQAMDIALKDLQLSGQGYPFGLDEDASDAFSRANAFWGSRALSQQTQDNLVGYGQALLSAHPQSWNQAPYRQLRQNALRILIPLTPEWMTA